MNIHPVVLFMTEFSRLEAHNPKRLYINKQSDNYSQNTLKTLQCCWYKFFAASVCVGTASKKN